MELSRLNSELKYIEANGVTLHIEEQTKLQLAAHELCTHRKSSSLHKPI